MYICIDSPHYHLPNQKLKQNNTNIMQTTIFYIYFLKNYCIFYIYGFIRQTPFIYIVKIKLSFLVPTYSKELGENQIENLSQCWLQYSPIFITNMFAHTLIYIYIIKFEAAFDK